VRRGKEVPTALREVVRPSHDFWRTEEPSQCLGSLKALSPRWSLERSENEVWKRRAPGQRGCLGSLRAGGWGNRQSWTG